MAMSLYKPGMLGPRGLVLVAHRTLSHTETGGEYYQRQYKGDQEPRCGATARAARRRHARGGALACTCSGTS